MPKSETPELPIDIIWENQNLNNKFEYVKKMLFWGLSLFFVIITLFVVKLMVNYQ